MTASSSNINPSNGSFAINFEASKSNHCARLPKCAIAVVPIAVSIIHPSIICNPSCLDNSIICIAGAIPPTFISLILMPLTPAAARSIIFWFDCTDSSATMGIIVSDCNFPIPAISYFSKGCSIISTFNNSSFVRYCFASSKAHPPFASTHNLTSGRTSRIAARRSKSCESPPSLTLIIG